MSAPDYDRAAWAAASDSMFQSMERNARIVAALRILAELQPANDDVPDLWRRAVQS